ncbi:type II 3-dehydroquinate dehydratase [Spiribacter sp. C176]|uniref:3-dehydroquinate dehydratase n=1 Tax=Spiribacter salilacus TaxID=2664894 RepID=A0A6N7QVC5_9GAMM|nr:type II 3-dehydroquinate dehydratase [Spiribacter salilacus]MRH78267.1 type II 3-dehydroquinate dehydratase [Spiribacter salilacus]
MKRILVLHGPNLNLLGQREPDVYGSTTLTQINSRLELMAKEAGAELFALQSNAEHTLVDRIQQAKDEQINGIIINPAGFTHTSVALRDALLAVAIPFIEVHLSNPAARESFRHQSFLTDVAKGLIAGLGPIGYELALQTFLQSPQQD